MNQTFHFENPRTVLKRHNLSAKKSWGQNFLVSEKAVRTIAEACCVEDSPILEIGGGLGTLTQGLLHYAASTVTVVEQDRDMCNVLETEFGTQERFSLISGDAAVFDYNTWLNEHQGVIAGNLPYQITGAILKQVLLASKLLRKAVFMVQKEVADRLCAPTSDTHRGALTVMVEARCDIKTILRLKPTAFFPPPKVRSAVVTLIPKQTDILGNVAPDSFDRVVKAAFATRRKTIQNSLAGALCSKEQAAQILEEANLPLTIRAQDVAVDQFVKLTEIAITQKIL